MGIHEQAGGGHKASGRPEELALQMHLGQISPLRVLLRRCKLACLLGTLARSLVREPYYTWPCGRADWETAPMHVHFSVRVYANCRALGEAYHFACKHAPHPPVFQWHMLIPVHANCRALKEAPHAP
eukprot:1138687-Pelagomonas_calceolata.AAC.13